MYLLLPDTECDTHKDFERQLMLEWKRLEEQLRIEKEQRQAELEAEREQRLKSDREAEERIRRISDQFKEELRRTEAANQVCLPVKNLQEILKYCWLKVIEQSIFLCFPAFHLQFELLEHVEEDGELSKCLPLEMVKQQVSLNPVETPAYKSTVIFFSKESKVYFAVKCSPLCVCV